MLVIMICFSSYNLLADTCSTFCSYYFFLGFRQKVYTSNLDGDIFCWLRYSHTTLNSKGKWLRKWIDLHKSNLADISLHQRPSHGPNLVQSKVWLSYQKLLSEGLFVRNSHVMDILKYVQTLDQCGRTKWMCITFPASFSFHHFSWKLVFLSTGHWWQSQLPFTTTPINDKHYNYCPLLLQADLVFGLTLTLLTFAKYWCPSAKVRSFHLIQICDDNN